MMKNSGKSSSSLLANTNTSLSLSSPTVLYTGIGNGKKITNNYNAGMKSDGEDEEEISTSDEPFHFHTSAASAGTFHHEWTYEIGEFMCKIFHLYHENPYYINEFGIGQWESDPSYC